MKFRSGIYLVPIDRWYVERAVWLIAGTVLLIITALAALDRIAWATAIYVLALASIVTALTGFCIVGSALKLLGFRAALGRNGATPGSVYLMQTDSWYLERRIYLAVGINLAVATTLTLLHSPWWLLFPAFVGVAMWVFAATGFCIMANTLYWSGAEPRLAPLQQAAEIPPHAAARGA